MLRNIIFVFVVWFFINLFFWMIEEYLNVPHKIYIYDIVLVFMILIWFLWMNL